MNHTGPAKQSVPSQQPALYLSHPAPLSSLPMHACRTPSRLWLAPQVPFLCASSSSSTTRLTGDICLNIALQPPGQAGGEGTPSFPHPRVLGRAPPRHDDACVHTAVSRTLISCVTRITPHGWLLHREPRTPSHAPTLQSEHNKHMLHSLRARAANGRPKLARSLLLLLLLLLGADITVARRIGSLCLCSLPFPTIACLLSVGSAVCAGRKPLSVCPR